MYAIDLKREFELLPHLIIDHEEVETYKKLQKNYFIVYNVVFLQLNYQYLFTILLHSKSKDMILPLLPSIIIFIRTKVLSGVVEVLEIEFTYVARLSEIKRKQFLIRSKQ